MSAPDNNAPPGEPDSPDFAQHLRSMMEAVHEGRTPSDVLLRFARSREQDTVHYCIQRMTEPDLSLMEEMMIARLLQQAGLVQQFVGALLSLDPQAAQNLARKLQTAERGLDLKIAPFLQSEDNDVVMHSLELLEVIAESKQIVPLLFGLISSDNPRIQSKAALIIQKLDSEQAYTRRLLQHPEARVRANALQGIADRANVQGGEFLLQGLTDSDHRVRTLAAVGLCRLGDPQGFQTLFRMLRDPKPIERRSAAWGLAVCGNASALPRLEVAARGDPDERVRELAEQACQKITERTKTKGEGKQE
jgi:HEAT repeat protein